MATRTGREHVPKVLSQAEIQSLLASLDNGWSWGPQGLSRITTFASYLDAVNFFNLLAPTCEEMDHHPDVTWSYTKVTLSLFTHSAQGVTNLDFELARTIDQVLRSFE